jgi:hypothetical protein
MMLVDERWMEVVEDRVQRRAVDQFSAFNV